MCLWGVKALEYRPCVQFQNIAGDLPPEKRHLHNLQYEIDHFPGNKNLFANFMPFEMAGDLYVIFLQIFSNSLAVKIVALLRIFSVLSHMSNLSRDMDIV